MIITTEKTISITTAEEWIKTIITKAIDYGSIETYLGSYENSYGNTRFYMYTRYSLNRLVIDVWDNKIEVRYHGGGINAPIIIWVYRYKV